jgi:hypothetical protein
LPSFSLDYAGIVASLSFSVNNTVVVVIHLDLSLDADRIGGGVTVGVSLDESGITLAIS